MDIEVFRQMVCDPSQTKSDLMTILKNVRQKGATEQTDIVVEVLDRRFPGWTVPRAKRGGKTPNVARFRGTEATFASAREGYIWLAERFLSLRPNLFTDPSSDTLFVALGNSRNYFAKTPAELFRGAPHLAADEANFARLINGWVANINLNNGQKFDILMRLAAVTGVRYAEEWEWRVHGATELLADKQRATIAADKLLDELFIAGAD